ncbi:MULTISPECIES: hypothetical protein [Vibrio]|uniref:hypothetical protein n=1 Tax=Vibrio TaxID=662 RepID=UPI000B5CBA6E|nr:MULTISPECIES: hypothetical protein [Vibrio]HBV76939.1 hypothetical protein [Vibrio sp.]
MKIEQLLQQCPHQFNEEELQALEANARALNKSTIKVFYGNYPAMFADLQAKLKAKYTHSEYDFNIKRNGCIELIYGIPAAKIKSNLAESLEKARADYQADLEAKQQQWIDEQLAEFIELERQEAEQAQVAKEAEYKKQLFNALKESQK